MSKVKTCINIDAEVKKKGQAKAKKKSRSFSNYLEILIEQDK